MKLKHLVLGASVLIVLVVWLLWPRARPTPDKRTTESQTLSSTGGAFAAGAKGPTSEDDRQLEAMVSSFDLSTEGGERERLARSLKIYKEATVYPPWSRPFDKNSAHLAAWNRPLPAGQEWAADESGEKAREIRTDLQLDRGFAGSGETITATVEVRYNDGDREPAQIDSLTGHVQTRPLKGGDWTDVAEVPFSRAGSVSIAQFRPTEIKGLGGAMHTRFAVKMALGRFNKVIGREFRFAADLPFEVLSVADDRVVDGSLEIDLRVHVRHVGATKITGILYDESGEKGIATYSRYQSFEDTGEQIVTLIFFGKAIREKGISGPYSLRGLHGHVSLASQDGGGKTPDEVGADEGKEAARFDHDQFWAYDDDPVLFTKAHNLFLFSDKDWDAAERRAKIRAYERAIEGIED